MTTAEELGFIKPVGTDLISNGDDAISNNADKSALMYDMLKTHATNEATAKANTAKTEAIADSKAYTDFGNMRKGNLATAPDWETFWDWGIYGVDAAAGGTFTALPPEARGPGVLTNLYTGPSYVAQIWQLIDANGGGMWRRTKFGATISPFEKITTSSEMNVLKADLEATKWLRGALSGTVLLNDLLTPGYYVASQSVANSFSPALPEAAQGPGILEVLYSGPSYVVQRWTAIGTNMARKWERQKFGTDWSEFRPVEWVAGFVPDGTDWDSVTTPGLYTLDSFTKAATMKNLPPVITSSFAGNIEVLPINATRVIQRATEYATRYSQTGRTWTRVQNNTGTFPEWEITSQEDAPQRASLTTIGDSLTAGGDIGGEWQESEKWPTILAGLIPATVRNLARSGDTTDEIMLRLGIYAPYFTASNIPASGSVVVTTTQKFGVRPDRPFAGILAGVIGTLTSGADETWTFTRTTAGTAVPLSGPTKFQSSAAGIDSDTLTLWMGRNDFSYGSKLLEQTMADHVVASHARVLEWMRPRYKHVMIAGVTTAKNEKSGSVNHTAITEVNTRLRTMFPGKFADVQRYLVNNCLTDAGLTPTAEDLAATAAGEIPPQLYAPNDEIHFSKTTAATLASHFFAPYLLGKGWV